MAIRIQDFPEVQGKWWISQKSQVGKGRAMKGDMNPIRIDVAYDDDGCCIYASRNGRVFAIGIAMHEGMGRKDTFPVPTATFLRSLLRVLTFHGGINHDL